MPTPTRMLYQNAVRDDRRLPPITKVVGLVLATFMRADGLAWPTVAALAEGAGVSESTARRALKQLAWCDLVQVEERRGRPNLYLATPVTAATGVGGVAAVTGAPVTGDQNPCHSCDTRSNGSNQEVAKGAGPATAAEAAAEIRRMLGADRRKAES